MSRRQYSTYASWEILEVLRYARRDIAADIASQTADQAFHIGVGLEITRQNGRRGDHGMRHRHWFGCRCGHSQSGQGRQRHNCANERHVSDDDC